MYKCGNLKALLFTTLFIIMLATQSASAGIFADVKMWVSEQANIREHTRTIATEVKALYRERKSIQRFAEGSSGLIRAYQAIRTKGSRINLPAMLDIAKSISLVLSEYKNIAPKAEAMYKKAQPSMSYFSKMADKTETIQTAKKKFLVKTFSEGRLESLAGANGWNRVFDTVKENPLNLFKWGRLSDEYKLGKVEGQYPLKCAQIAFEASGFFFAAKESVQDLLGIQKEIDGIMGGNLSSILNLGSTIDKVQNIGGSVDSLGALAEKGTQHLNTRLDELVKIQDQYVAANKAYNEKYNKSGTTPSTVASAPSASYTPATNNTTSATTGSVNVPAVSLQKAMENYQKAYEAYAKISQSGNASQAQVNRAVENLRIAKQQVEQAKARSR